MDERSTLLWLTLGGLTETLAADPCYRQWVGTAKAVLAEVGSPRDEPTVQRAYELFALCSEESPRG